MTNTGQPPTPSSQSPMRDALARLTPFGWIGGIATILAVIAASFFLAGYFAPYWRNADMDFMVVYNALAMNDGRPQSFFDHPGYFTILSVKAWFEALHRLGLLNAFRLSAIPSAADLPAFEAAMTSAIRAARLVAWLTASAAVVVFAVLMRRLMKNWRVALLATLTFALSGGLALHIRLLRSEMISACLVVFALMTLILVARRASAYRPFWLAAAAALCVLGLENKVQAIFPIASFVLLLLPFGSAESASVPFWRRPAPAWTAVIAAAIAAGSLIWLALPILLAGFNVSAATQSGLRPLLAGSFGLYQAALVIALVAGMIAFARLWNVSAAETAASLFAVAGGAALGLLALYLDYNVNNVTAILNPVEKMMMYAGFEEGAQSGVAGKLYALISNTFGMLARYTYFLRTSSRPTVFLIWLIVPGIVYAWRKGERQTAIQALFLMLVAFGIDTLGNQRGRGLPLPYYVFTDPLIILAGAILLDRLSELRFAKWAYATGIALIAVHVVFSQAEPVKLLTRSKDPAEICTWNMEYLQLLPLPWCSNPPVRSQLFTTPSKSLG